MERESERASESERERERERALRESRSKRPEISECGIPELRVGLDSLRAAAAAVADSLRLSCR